MTQRDSVLFKSGWISLAIIGLAILVFGLIVTVVPTSSDPLYMRAIGVASIGMGLFGLLITLIAYRRRERWAWFALWYYPLFWTAHLVGGLPPGKDHVHQVVFIVVSLAGLLLPVREFFPARGSTDIHDPVKVPTTANFVELRQPEVRLRLGLEGLTQRGHNAPAGIRVHKKPCP